MRNKIVIITFVQKVAYEWHSGQWSPLYSFASTGYIDDSLVGEIEDIIKTLRESTTHDNDYNQNIYNLNYLLDYVNERIENNDTDIQDDWDYYFERWRKT